MTLVGRGGVAPECIHAGTYAVASTVPASYSVVTTPAPSQGLGRFKAVNPAATWWLQRSGMTFAAQPWTWLVQRDFRAVGTFSAGSNFCIGIMNFEALGLRGFGQASGKYKVALVDLTGAAQGTSTTEYASNVDITIRVQWNGSEAKVWINGLLEITVATTGRPTTGQMILWWLASDMATVTKYWGVYSVATSDTEADRIGTNLRRGRLDPTGDTTEDDFGQQGASCVAGDATFSNWDDYAGGGAPDDATTFNCGATLGTKQVSSLSTVTVADVVLGVAARYWAHANIGDKGHVQLLARLKYAGNAIDAADPLEASATWVGWAEWFSTPPGGGAWSQTIIDGLECGCSRFGSAAANLDVSAMAVEVFWVDADPPAYLDLEHDVARGSRRGVLRGVA